MIFLFSRHNVTTTIFFITYIAFFHASAHGAAIMPNEDNQTLLEQLDNYVRHNKKVQLCIGNKWSNLEGFRTIPVYKQTWLTYLDDSEEPTFLSNDQVDFLLQELQHRHLIKKIETTEMLDSMFDERNLVRILLQFYGNQNDATYDRKRDENELKYFLI